MRDLKTVNKNWFDRWSKDYDQFIFRKLMWYWQDRTVRELPLNASTILEVACGTGIGTEKLAKRFPQAKILAIDLSPEMVRIARHRLRRIPNVRVEVGDVERLDFRKKFDAIFCTEAFHHFPSPVKAVFEMARVLKPRGIIAITDINIPPLAIMNGLFKLEPGFVRMYSRSQFRELFETQDLKIIRQKRIGIFALMTIAQAR